MGESRERNVTDVKGYMIDNPDELVVSIYERLKPGILCSFPLDDAILYAENVLNREIRPYMEQKYSSFHWTLIWAKIQHDREQAKAV
jgi:hypothetical protein